MDHAQIPPEFRMSLHALPYDLTVPHQAPIPITTPSSEPTAEQLKGHSVVRLPYVSTKSTLRPERDPRRDSGLANSSLRHSGASVNTADHSTDSLRSKPSGSQIQIDSEATLGPPSSKSEEAWLAIKPKRSITDLSLHETSFQPICLDIPTSDLGLVNDLHPENMEFSNRGSVLMRRRKVTDLSGLSSSHRPTTQDDCRAKSIPSLRKEPRTRILSTDEEMLSRKVRSYYESGMDNSAIPAPALHRDGPSQDTCPSPETAPGPTSTSETQSEPSPNQKTSDRHGVGGFRREVLELAGGLEDWQDVKGGDVDRYGFIIPSSSAIRSSTPGDVGRSSSAREPRSLQRVSTSLQLAAEAPRQKHAAKRVPSRNVSGPNPAIPDGPSTTQPSRRLSRPASSQSSYQRSLAGRSSRLRNATNRLPQNRDRRFVDQAGDMLTLPSNWTDSNAESGGCRAKDAVSRRKEIEREEKWQKMATVVSKREDGGGTRFDFDTNSAKVIERTWKGIPDRWRATAWHAFLSTSAKKQKDSVSDERLMEMFGEYQDLASPDDVQIDIDVPRTISSHIMFRRRYRGGQRLLFRVLHAMSLHFSSTAYVQGMATIAATLLAYYDEENAFVMLVRLWELRGLEKLYTAGFAGLMEALDDFQSGWLNGGDISARLTELGIPPTSYGTRWYLTLFNYSIPFSAQLRVWDVFMLLGDSHHVVPPAGHQSSSSSSLPAGTDAGKFGSTLDVLHATSAALIDGTRAILLESDFENAMKVLTSWVPIQDADLFMRVAKAEWKVHRRKG